MAKSGGGRGEAYNFTVCVNKGFSKRFFDWLFNMKFHYFICTSHMRHEQLAQDKRQGTVETRWYRRWTTKFRRCFISNIWQYIWPDLKCEYWHWNCAVHHVQRTQIFSSSFIAEQRRNEGAFHWLPNLSISLNHDYLEASNSMFCPKNLISLFLGGEANAQPIYNTWDKEMRTSLFHIN